MSIKSYETSAEERERPLFWKNHEALWESSQGRKHLHGDPWRGWAGSECRREPREQTQHPPQFPGRAGRWLWEWGVGAEGEREVFGGVGADC